MLSAGVSVATATLSENGRKARYGVAYLRAICAQAGVPLSETEPDEDVVAIDATVRFAENDVRVQVKCTSQFTIRGRSASWPVKDNWLKAWNTAKVPVYFVLVIVPSDIPKWLDHDDSGTLHRCAAFWVRLLPDKIGSKILVPKNQRLTERTIEQWHKDLLRMYSPGIS